MGAMGRNWRQERKRDPYYKMAKREGYRSRAAYKLIQIQDKYRLMKPGFRVVDLGCAPGGWLQVASSAVGPRGLVIGVDVKPVKPLKTGNVVVLTGDLADPELPERILAEAGGWVDVVLSDVSPNISGVWEVDHARQIDLAEKALTLASKVLSPGGAFLVKVFEGEFSRSFLGRLRQAFEKVKIVKPKASRSRSAEVYMLASGFKGRPPPRT